ncbi:TetR/AcrR family transcriptional regulator C-terminal domain-containing protein [Oerskovia sp. M15]
MARAAVGLADREGALGALSMRKVAADLGIGTMSLYTYVQNKDDLVDLVVDRAYGELYPHDEAPGATWQDRLRSVARANWDLFATHPWLLDIDLARPVLGPGETRKYDVELRAIEGIGLDDVAMDATVTLVVGQATTAARRARAGRAAHATSGQTDDEWWAANAPPRTDQRPEHVLRGGPRRQHGGRGAAVSVLGGGGAGLRDRADPRGDRGTGGA